MKFPKTFSQWFGDSVEKLPPAPWDLRDLPACADHDSYDPFCFDCVGNRRKADEDKALMSAIKKASA